MEWIVICEEPTKTLAMEIAGVGCVIAITHNNVASTTFVPHARIKDGAVVRDIRNSPPLVGGVKASDIQARPDPGAQQFYTSDEPDY